jgi:hypothetical protein
MHDYEAMIAAYRTGRTLATRDLTDNALIATEHLPAMARDSYGYRTDDERDAFIAGYRHAASDSRLKQGLTLLAPRRG